MRIIFKPLSLFIGLLLLISRLIGISIWGGFSYNNIFHSSISMAPYEALYVRWCTNPIGLFEVDESSLLGPDFIYKSLEKVHNRRNQLQTT